MGISAINFTNAVATVCILPYVFRNVWVEENNRYLKENLTHFSMEEISYLYNSILIQNSNLEFILLPMIEENFSVKFHCAKDEMARRCLINSYARERMRA